MGTRTPFIGIYIPAAGETNYDQSFASGMMNIDSHDHSGATNKGVPINSSGLADGSVTYKKLNTDVADTTSGLGFNALLPNQLQIQGILNALYVMGLSGGTGFLVRNGAAVATRNFINGKGMNVSPLNGSTDTTFAIADTVINPTQPSFCAEKAGDAPLAVGDNTITFSLTTGNRNFTQGTGWSNPTFTAPATGVYSFSTGVGFNAIVGSGEVTTFLYINGGAQSYQLSKFKVPDSAAAGGALFISGSVTVKLTAADTVNIVVNVIGLTGISAYATSFFSGALLY